MKKTKIYDWTSNINSDELNNCIEVLKNGGIIVFPTETVYGIGANAFFENSVKEIYRVKKRPNEKPLAIMVSGIEEIEKYAVISNEIERKIIKKFMPGPITIILKRKKGVLDYVASGKDTIGVRIPDNRIILEILRKSKLPIVAPSANISGMPSGIDFNSIKSDFEGNVDICINGGKCKLEEPSTIIQVVDNEIEILRQGKIKKQDIEQVL